MLFLQSDTVHSNNVLYAEYTGCEIKDHKTVDGVTHQ